MVAKVKPKNNGAIDRANDPAVIKSPFILPLSEAATVLLEIQLTAVNDMKFREIHDKLKIERMIHLK